MSCTATTRQPWRFPPLGAKRALSSTLRRISAGTGSGLNRRVVGAQRIASYSSTACTLPVLDRPDHARRRAGRDRERLHIVRDDAIRADHAALTDAHAAGDHDVGAKPGVLTDARRPLALEALPGDRAVGVVVAVARVRDE